MSYIMNYLQLYVCVVCVLSWTRGDNLGKAWRPRFIRDAATDRDSQYILDMIETLANTIDNRLGKIDSIDTTYRTMADRVSKKLDNLDQRIGDTGVNVGALLNAVRALDSKLVFVGGMGNKGMSENVNNKLQDLTSKVDVLSNRLTQLRDEVTVHKKPHDLTMQASERRHIVSTPDGKGLRDLIAAEKVGKDLESVKNALRNLDTKMNVQMDRIGNTVLTMAQAIREVRGALIDTTTSDWGLENRNLTSNGVNATKQHTTATTKFETLLQKLRPLLRIADRMDELYNTVLGTRHSVEDTRQKSDQLLTHSYHTVQALNDVKNDMYLQTNKIMDNLGQVEQWLREQQTGAASNLDPKFLHAGLKELLDKVDEDEKERISQRLPSGDFDDPVDIPKIVTSSMSSIEVIQGPHRVPTPLLHNITKVSVNVSYSETCPFQEHPGINCADLKSRGVNKSGVYYILIKGTTYWFMKVYCEMETAGGGWTVIQRRDDFGEPHESFNRDWNEYKNGFGDLTKEFWLGNENIFMLTNQDEYTLRIDLEDFDGNKRFAEYSKFKLYSEAENYKLEIGGYDGTAGDSLNDPWYGSNLSPFSTYNRDNDRSSLNCASMLRGGWWWRSCGRGLNGLYLTDPNDLAARQGIVWFRWRGWDYTLKRAQIMIRPKTFVPSEQQLFTQEQRPSKDELQEQI